MTLKSNEANAEVRRVLKHSHLLQPNLTKEGWKAIKHVRTDREQMALMANKE